MTSKIKSNVKSNIVTVTPELAARWLEGNTHNRPLRQANVESMMAAMQAGRWRLNGESIIFDTNGTLVDGQHRLWACVESKCQFETVVVTDVDPDSFLTIDQGAKRSAADALWVNDKELVKGAKLTGVAAAAILVWQYRNENLFSNVRLPSTDVVRLVNEEPRLIHWVKEAGRAARGLRGFSTPVAATLHLGCNGFPEKAEEFLHRFVDGMNLGQGNPILALRGRILSNPPYRTWERLYLSVSAWNAFAQGRQLFKITATPRSDDFPKIRGAA